MEFFDCNASFGLPAKPGPSPATCPTIDDLHAQLRRAGIARALVWTTAEHDVAPRRGNALLAEAIRPHADLFGVWTVLPDQTGEMNVDQLLADMKRDRIVALRAFPFTHRFLLNRLTVGPLLGAMVERRIPLIYSIRRSPDPHAAWTMLHGLMTEFRHLTLIIADHGTWGCDRYFRPLLDAFPRVFVDTTLYFLDGGIEDLVARYGPGRLVFGSGLPERYPGGMMLYIRHAEIADDAKDAIASGNLDRLVREVQL